MRVEELESRIEADDDELLDEPAAARFISMSPRTLQRWRRLKKGPRFVRLNNFRIKYRKSVLQDYLADSTEVLEEAGAPAEMTAGGAA